MVSERALRTRWNKRQADRRAYEAGLLRDEGDSLLSAVRGRLLMIVTDEGFRAGAMLAHRAAAVDQRGRQVGQRGQWHRVRRPAGRDGQEHRGQRLHRPHPGAGRRDHDQWARSGAWAEAAAGDGVGVTGGIAGGPDQPGVAVPNQGQPPQNVFEIARRASHAARPKAGDLLMWRLPLVARAGTTRT